MTLQKLKPCPICKTDEYLEVYTYESGWRYVECVKCNLLGPGEGNQVQAVRSWNRWDARDRLEAEAAKAENDLGRVASTCIETAYGSTTRLSFQIKVF